jgi:hypothetical protein
MKVSNRGVTIVGDHLTLATAQLVTGKGPEKLEQWMEKLSVRDSPHNTERETETRTEHKEARSEYSQSGQLVTGQDKGDKLSNGERTTTRNSNKRGGESPKGYPPNMVNFNLPKIFAGRKTSKAVNSNKTSKAINSDIKETFKNCLKTETRDGRTGAGGRSIRIEGGELVRAVGAYGSVSTADTNSTGGTAGVRENTPAVEDIDSRKQLGAVRKRTAVTAHSPDSESTEVHGEASGGTNCGEEEGLERAVGAYGSVSTADTNSTGGTAGVRENTPVVEDIDDLKQVGAVSKRTPVVAPSPDSESTKVHGEATGETNCGGAEEAGGTGE